MVIWAILTWSYCGVMDKSFRFPTSRPGFDSRRGNFFQDFSEFSKCARFPKFCEKTWNQQLRFYNSWCGWENSILAPPLGSLISIHRRQQNSGVYDKTKMIYCIEFMKIYFAYFDLRGHSRPLEVILSSANRYPIYYCKRGHHSVHLADAIVIFSWGWLASIFYFYVNQIVVQLKFRFQALRVPH